MQRTNQKGPRKRSSLLLPLHQRLKLLRKQQEKNKGSSLGAALPDKFVDPLMGGVMNSPVKLPSSGKVCERKVVTQCLNRDGKDPFDDSPLSAEALISCIDLKAEIAEWKVNKQKALFSDASGDDENGEDGGFRVKSDDIKVRERESVCACVRVCVNE